MHICYQGEDQHKGVGKVVPLTLKPGESVNLNFNSLIQIGSIGDKRKPQSIIITPIKGNTYDIILMGESLQTLQVKAS